jgi:hypothetical protein
LQNASKITGLMLAAVVASGSVFASSCSASTCCAYDPDWNFATSEFIVAVSPGRQ